nr:MULTISPECIES: N-acetylmuramoyl-L-alanine amidase [Mycobacteriaceae]
MGRIWGVIWHHTGNARESAQSIRNGRPDLAGPLAQLHIAPDGTVTIVAVGPCNHAGRGSWTGLPTDNANGLTIGIECAWPSDASLTEATQTRERWPDAQIVAMRDTGAAISAYLGVDASHNISHEEWAKFGPAGFRQGKWDPGNLDMDWFRGEITKAMNGEFNTTPTTPEEPMPTLDDLTPAEQHELLDGVRWIKQQLGPNIWGPASSMGKNDSGQELTVRDGLAAHLRKAGA